MKVIHIRKGLYVIPVKYNELIDMINKAKTIDEMKRLIEGANQCKHLTDKEAQFIGGGSHWSRIGLILLFKEIIPDYSTARDVFFISTDPPESYWKIVKDLTQ